MKTLLAALLGIFFCGCGVKGRPTPRNQPPPITDGDSIKYPAKKQ